MTSNLAIFPKSMDDNAAHVCFWCVSIRCNKIHFFLFPDTFLLFSFISFWMYCNIIIVLIEMQQALQSLPFIILGIFIFILLFFLDPPSPPVVGVADVTSSSVGIHWKTTDNKQPSIVRKLS